MNGEFIMMESPQFHIAVLVDQDELIDRAMLIYLRDTACQALPWLVEEELDL
jgi:hypothetical protein